MMRHGYDECSLSLCSLYTGVVMRCLRKEVLVGNDTRWKEEDKKRSRNILKRKRRRKRTKSTAAGEHEEFEEEDEEEEG